MLVKKEVGNHIVLPASIAESFAEVAYFELTVDNGRIVLSPTNAGDQVRHQLEQLGITEQDIEDAVTWARQHS